MIFGILKQLLSYGDSKLICIENRLTGFYIMAIDTNRKHWNKGEQWLKKDSKKMLIIKESW